MSENEIAWVDVAYRVLDGAYEHADSATRQSIEIGLRQYDNAKCRLAIERLNRKKKR